MTEYIYHKMSGEVQSFPLYDQLVELGVTQPPPDVWGYMPNLTVSEAETVYALIYHHFIKESKGGVRRQGAPPYNGKVFEQGRGVVFPVKDLPLSLQRVLGAYVVRLTGHT